MWAIFYEDLTPLSLLHDPRRALASHVERKEVNFSTMGSSWRTIYFDAIV